ncbi:MAG: hopanoid biosynthesis-associated protein HpnK [Pseudomonadota bacterium]|nr:hopanoid biosynthesis-associated protein HpnK [Pseudomonadota bacterium]
MKALIITADDFGFSLAVNEAVEEAHRRGVLGTASLMVGAPAARDAVARAARLPGLKVGLHLVVAGAPPVLSPAEIPALVDPRGRLSSRLFRAGVDFYLRPAVRAQLAREIRAQFEWFRGCGLALDHVNCHKHLHLHPTVFALIAEIGAAYGLKAVRLPREPLSGFLPDLLREDGPRQLAATLLLRPWVRRLRGKIRASGLQSNDFILGMRDSGRMGLARVLRLLPRLPVGVTEMYFHPAVRSSPELSSEAPGACHAEEFAALMDPSFRRALDDLGVRRIGFSDLPLPRGS